MAIKLENKQNVLAPNADYQYGNIKNSSGSGTGTPVDVNTYADFHQFFSRLMDVAGVAYNDLPDNTTNGYQLFDALAKLAGSAPWIDAGAPTLSTNGVGTVALFSTIYNRYKISGKTLHWHLAIGVTPTGSPTQIKIAFPSWGATAKVTTTGANSTVGVYRGLEPLICAMDSTHINIARVDNTGSGAPAFVNSSYQIAFKISLEIA